MIKSKKKKEERREQESPKLAAHFFVSVPSSRLISLTRFVSISLLVSRKRLGQWTFFFCMPVSVGILLIRYSSCSSTDDRAQPLAAQIRLDLCWRAVEFSANGVLFHNRRLI